MTFLGFRMFFLPPYSMFCHHDDPQSVEAGWVVECWCTVLDLKGMGMRQVGSAFLSVVKAFR
jgi:hypothetical protein